MKKSNALSIPSLYRYSNVIFSLIAVAGLVSCARSDSSHSDKKATSIEQSIKQSGSFVDQSEWKAPSGKTYRVINTTDPGLHALPEDEKGDSTGSPNTTTAADLKIYEDDWFIGEKRALAKTSFAHAKVRTFRNIRALLENLPASDNTMRHYDPPLDSSSPRTPEEMINVGVCTSIIAAKKEPDHDYHMIIGDVGGPYLIAEVSGIPRRGDRYTQGVLLNVRRAFENFIANEHRSGKNYSGWGDPLPVYIEGSLFYDITRRKVEGGPKFAKTETLWEIHPVTKIIFEPERCP